MVLGAHHAGRLKSAAMLSIAKTTAAHSKQNVLENHIVAETFHALSVYCSHQKFDTEVAIHRWII